MPLKDVALPAVGAKMSTTNGNTAGIAGPVGMIHVQLIEGVRTRSEDGQTPATVQAVGGRRQLPVAAWP